MTAHLACAGIVFDRGATRVLDGASLAFGAGDVVALLGVNGAGKSTLLRILLGLLKPGQGSIMLDGRPLHAYSRQQVAAHVAYVPQSHVASFPYTVRQMVSMGRLPHAGLSMRLRPVDNDVIDQAMARLRIGHLAARSYMQLSGGERQRVLLALLGELAAEGHAVLHTTHLPEHALRGATRAVLLEHGRVIADGAPAAIITAAAMNAFYDVDLAQVDAGTHRFFVPQSL